MILLKAQPHELTPQVQICSMKYSHVAPSIITHVKTIWTVAKSQGILVACPLKTSNMPSVRA